MPDDKLYLVTLKNGEVLRIRAKSPTHAHEKARQFMSSFARNASLRGDQKEANARLRNYPVKAVENE